MELFCAGNRLLEAEAESTQLVALPQGWTSLRRPARFSRVDQGQRLAREGELCKDSYMSTKLSAPGKSKKVTSRKVSGSVLSAHSGESMTIQLYNTVIEKASSKGVKLAKPVRKEANPYLLPPKDAVKAAKKAGIITRAGNLSPKFK